MTLNQANKLRVGHRVMWGGDAADRGTVDDAPMNAAGVHIAWDNGQKGWLDKRDMSRVSVVECVLADDEIAESGPCTQDGCPAHGSRP